MRHESHRRVRHKSKSRSNFDLCATCFADPSNKKTGEKFWHCILQWESPYSSRDGGSPGQAPTFDTHVGVYCDGCGTSPIVGLRHKSIGRPNFNLCAKCFADPSKTEEGEDFLHCILYWEPSDARHGGGSGSTAPIFGTHVGIYCDGCGTDPIVGVRHKSMSRPAFDLCATCFADPSKKKEGEDFLRCILQWEPLGSIRPQKSKSIGKLLLKYEAFKIYEAL